MDKRNSQANNLRIGGGSLEEKNPYLSAIKSKD